MKERPRVMTLSDVRRAKAVSTTAVATAEGCTSRRPISPAADTVFTLFFAIPIEGGRGTA